MDSSKTTELNRDHDQQANFVLIDLVAAEEEEKQTMQGQDMQDQEDQSQVRLIPTACDECEANIERCAKLSRKNQALKHKLDMMKE